MLASERASRKRAEMSNLSVAEIADLTDTSQKTIRAYLRRNHTRSAELKNSRWGDAKKAYSLSAKLTKELVERFTTAEESESESESEQVSE